MATKIYSRFDRPKKDGITFTEKTRTQQHFAKEVDINEIVKRAINTGDVTVLTPQQRGEYYDCTAFEDYQQALEYVAAVEEDFFTLPSAVRKEFGNDPDAYVQFMSEPKNFAKAVELGLLQGSGDKTPPAAPVAPEQPPAGPSETPLPESDA